MRSFVKNYVKGCGTCQQFKINRNPSHPTFMPIEGPKTTRPFANCSMDMITDLPPVTHNGEALDAILVVVDHGLTKGVIIIACSKTLTSEGAAELLLDNLLVFEGPVRSRLVPPSGANRDRDRLA